MALTKGESGYHMLTIAVALGTLIGAAVSFATQDVHRDAEQIHSPFLFDHPLLLMMFSGGAVVMLLSGAYLLGSSREDASKSGTGTPIDQGTTVLSLSCYLVSLSKITGALVVCAGACLALALGFGPENAARPDYDGPSGGLDKTLFGFMYGGLALLSAIAMGPELKKSLFTKSELSLSGLL